MPLDSKDIDRLVNTYREDYHPDVERGLSRLRERIANAPPDITGRANRRRSLIYRLTAVAAAVLFLVFSLLFLIGDGLEHLTTDGDRIAVHVLPDGSRITLQGGSEATYDPDEFDLQDRKLTLTGQAFFEIFSDADRPFLVDNGVSELRVTGTAFNLRSENGLMEVEVSQGTVELGQGSKKIAVAVNECGLSQSGQPLQRKPAPNLNNHAWRTGNLKFERTPISEVFTYFKANWNIDCSWVDGKACDYPVSGSYRGRNAADVLADVAKLGGLTVRIDDSDPKHFIFSGSCAG